jgi:UDP-glucose 4-epimerase
VQVLVTGGAGYIGSVVAEELLKDGYGVVVYDNFVKGHRKAIPPGAAFVHADLMDGATLRETLSKHSIGSVVHMAADSLVGESYENPAKYYRNNVVAGLALLDAMLDTGVKSLVFSSTAAVYGEPEKQPIEENDPVNPTNPYGQSKLAFEQAMRWYDEAYGLRYASLRYFNAAGASAHCGEWHDPETHLIPLVLQAAAGRRAAVEVYGDDYSTRDGTCVRDYIHVIDLAQAHVFALKVLDQGSRIYNLGCGADGYTVREVIDAAREVTGKEVGVRIGSRRPGDPAILIASSEKIKRELGWSPSFQDLRLIIESAWRWMLAHPNGYAA